MQNDSTVGRRTLLIRAGLATVALAAPSTLAACGTLPGTPEPGPSADGKTGGPTPGDTSAPEPSPSPTPDARPVKLASNIEDGATDVKVDKVVKVKATDGTVTKVTLSYKGEDKDGEKKTFSVPGDLNDDATEWRARSGLDPAADYKLVVIGASAAEEKETVKTSFTTRSLSLDEQTFPTLFPADGEKVGVGMPVIITFDLAIKDKAEFEKHLEVTSSPKQEGTWHWVNDKEVHFRPKKFWKSGTKVSVKANLNGVNAGGGIYGQHSRGTEFTIGRSVITKIDLKKKRAKVYIDGEYKKTLPISAGKPGFTTRSGTKLIMDKLRYTKMASETIGIANKNNPDYYSLDVEFALRITASGEFIHAAPWNAGMFGEVNGSHGCVGMSTSDARWLYKHTSVGDPTITKGTKKGLEQGNGWSDWDISYAEYKKGSAL